LGPYKTYETDRTNESAARTARDGLAVWEVPKELYRGSSLEIVAVTVVVVESVLKQMV
jgi:hypothetical protein